MQPTNHAVKALFISSTSFWTIFWNFRTYWHPTTSQLLRCGTRYRINALDDLHYPVSRPTFRYLLEPRPSAFASGIQQWRELLHHRIPFQEPYSLHCHSGRCQSRECFLHRRTNGDLFDKRHSAWSRQIQCSPQFGQEIARNQVVHKNVSME